MTSYRRATGRPQLYIAMAMLSKPRSLMLLTSPHRVAVRTNSSSGYRPGQQYEKSDAPTLFVGNIDMELFCAMPTAVLAFLLRPLSGRWSNATKVRRFQRYKNLLWAHLDLSDVKYATKTGLSDRA